jgi:hypothetical protein
MKAWYAVIAGILFLPPILAIVAYIFVICPNVMSPIVSPMYSHFIPAAQCCSSQWRSCKVTWQSTRVNDGQMIDLTDDRSMTETQPPVIFSHSAVTLAVSSSLRDVRCPMGYIIYIRSLIHIQAAYPRSRASAVSSSRSLAMSSSPAASKSSSSYNSSSSSNDRMADLLKVSTQCFRVKSKSL